MLAANWRKHKESKDEVYTYYKTLDAKQVFCKKARENVCAKYPELNEEDISVLTEKMYKLWKEAHPE